MLTSTATTLLRTTTAGAVRSSAAGPGATGILLRGVAYSTAAPLPPFSLTTQPSKFSCSKQSQLLPTAPGTSSVNPLLLRFRIQTQQRRAASSAVRPPRPRTDAEIDASAAEAAAAAQSAAHPEQPPLDWNTFFKLRKTRRNWQLAFSFVSALGAGATASILLTSGVADSLVSQVPLDPFIALGLMVFGFTGLGWLVGPSLGSTVFNLMNKSTKAQMAIKESQFFARIKKHRVDPSSSSMGNPVPDFYGEKISSVAGYRQWLKDQRAFNRKRNMRAR
ncbi:mitochondrial import protein Pam17-domain-containing protein [Rhypophila decipiens]|uniref:Presequence translocated-associated motor subunit PAM17 n=1 Tax=Rhypophila decipiens TaxID=261697 RepID=A0AAN6Y1G1_9PEZI|nr:mitochondrial import protein Pam17-domain-containing protein [Rhypophila decipiens]